MLGNFLYGRQLWKEDIRKKLFSGPEQPKQNSELREMSKEDIRLPTNRKRFLSSPAEKSLSKRHKDLIEGNIEDFLAYLDNFEEWQKQKNTVAMDANMAAKEKPSNSKMDTNDNSIMTQMHTVFGPYFEQLQNQIKNLEFEIKTKDKRIEDLEQKVDTFMEETTCKFDELDQNHKSNSLRLHGIPETEGEDTDRVFIKTMKDNLNLEINPMEISNSHRIGKPGTEKRPLIVKLTRESTKNKIFKVKKELKSKDSMIFINEDLTQKTSSFFKQVRDLKKEGLIKRTWTRDGKVFYVPNDQEEPKMIQSTAEIEIIREANKKNE